MVKVWTGELAQLEGKDFLNITVKSGEKIFAPTWKMVMGRKEGRMTEEEYIAKYEKMMRESYRMHQKRWEEILHKDEIVLACYCKPGVFCHRILLAKIIERLGGVYMGEKHT